MSDNHYFTGLPCRNGHISVRRKTDKVCLACERKKASRYLDTDKGAALKLRRNRTPASKARKKRYLATEKGKLYKWRLNHSEKYKLSRKRFDKSPKGKACAVRSQHFRRARIAGTGIKPFTFQDRTERFALFENSCAYCGSQQNLSEDHLIPIATGGRHEIANIVPACLPCNQRKNAQTVRQWYKKQSFYKQENWYRILWLVYQ